MSKRMSETDLHKREREGEKNKEMKNVVRRKREGESPLLSLTKGGEEGKRTRKRSPFAWAAFQVQTGQWQWIRIVRELAEMLTWEICIQIKFQNYFSWIETTPCDQELLACGSCFMPSPLNSCTGSSKTSVSRFWESHAPNSVLPLLLLLCSYMGKEIWAADHG